MALETVVAQITPEAPFVSKKEPSMLPVCCLCGLIRDKGGIPLERERWITRRGFFKTHGINPADCVLAHTYCPSCFTEGMETTRQLELEGP